VQDLVHRNVVLKECRNLVQSFHVEHARGFIRFKLETGWRESRSFDDKPV